MSERKSTPLWGLFFRELYLGKRTYISTTGIYAIFMVIIYLIVFSFNVGFLKDAGEEALEFPKQAVRTVAVCFPAVVFALNTISIFELGNHDSGEKWSRFLYSSPASEKKFFAVKFAMSFLISVVGFLLSLLNAYIVCSIIGLPLTYSDVAIMAMLTLLIIFATTLITVVTFLFKSSTIGTLSVFLLIFLYAVICVWSDSFLGMKEDEIFIISNNSGEISQEFLDKITGICEGVFPFTLLILTAVLALGWLLCVLITKNRDRRVPLKKHLSEKNKAVKE